MTYRPAKHCDHCGKAFYQAGHLCHQCKKLGIRVPRVDPINTIHTLGFIFPNGRPTLSDPAEYNDFAGKTFNLADVKPMLDMGVFPVGLIVQVEKAGTRGPLGVVVRDPEGGLMVEQLEKVVMA